MMYVSDIELDDDRPAYKSGSSKSADLHEWSVPASSKGAELHEWSMTGSSKGADLHECSVAASSKGAELQAYRRPLIKPGKSMIAERQVYRSPRIKPGKSRNAERRAYTVLASVCWYWRHILTDRPESPTSQWVKHQVKKLIQRKCTCMF